MKAYQSVLRSQKFSSFSSRTKNKFLLLGIGSFWYLALFPGRLGFDYSEAIRMMQRDESTDWWTAEFWWYLKLTTLNGRFIFISSLISIAIFGSAVYYFVQSLPLSEKIRSRTLIIYFCTPLFGGFALNISHDVFQAAGIILLVGIQMRKRAGSEVKNVQILQITSAILVLTTAIGPLLIGTYLIVLLVEKNLKHAVAMLIVSVAFAGISNFGVTKVPRIGFVLPILGDIKCIVQHPDVSLPSDDWQVLEKIASKDTWLEKKTCSFVDEQIEDFKVEIVEKTQLSPELVKLYFRLVAEYPAITAVAHFQRASQALPPPFFQGPSNQIDLDPSEPLGIKTNTALQDGPELLHPSIDEPTVDSNVPILKPLEIVAQGAILIVNQASWFWGWGGFWLWPILIFGLLIQKMNRTQDWLKIYTPVITLHAFLVIVLSAPQGRYVMSTITIGFVMTIAFFSHYLTKIFREKSE